MIHEVLVCLAGHSGDILEHVRSDNNDPSSNNLQSDRNKGNILHAYSSRIAPEFTVPKRHISFPIGDAPPVGDEAHVPLLLETEQVALLELCQLGASVLFIQDFVKKFNPLHRDILPGSHPKRLLYLGAFVRGARETERTYQTSLVQLEKRILNSTQNHDSDFRGGKTPLSVLRLELCHFETLFKALVPFLKKVDVHFDKSQKDACDDTSDVVLFEWVWDASQSGIPIIRQTFSRYYEILLDLFIQHIESWMIWGSLPISGSFFIRSIPIGVSGQDINANQKVANERPIHESERIWKQYEVDKTMIPFFFSTKRAEDVLFVGKASLLLKHHYYYHRKHAVSPHSPREMLQSISNVSLRSGKLHEPHDLLSRQRLLNEWIVNTKSVISGQLWSTLVQDEHIGIRLEMIQTVFLCRNADFTDALLTEWDRVVQQASLSLRTPTTFEIQKGFQVAWDSVFGETALAAYKTMFSISSREHVALTKTDSLNHQSMQNNSIIDTMITLFPGVNLELHIPIDSWPLNLFLSQRELILYNRLFWYLLYLRKLQRQIQSTIKYQFPTMTPQLQRLLFALRGRMMYFMNSWLRFVNMDTIHPHSFHDVNDTMSLDKIREEMKLSLEDWDKNTLSRWTTTNAGSDANTMGTLSPILTLISRFSLWLQELHEADENGRRSLKSQEETPTSKDRLERLIDSKFQEWNTNVTVFHKLLSIQFKSTKGASLNLFSFS